MIFFSASLKKLLATKVQRHEVKNATHFPLWLCAFVAKLNFVKIDSSSKFLFPFPFSTAPFFLQHPSAGCN
jgi:hypothetical protein